VVDDEDIDGSVGGLELKAELTLEGSAEGRGGVPISGSAHEPQ
jgi:hypothetical protein